MYKTKKFRIRTVEELKRDIDLAKEFYGRNVRTVFLADSDSIILKTSHLISILDYLRESFPKLERVTSYGRSKTIIKTKTVEDLKKLRKAGLKRLHVGLETGADWLLREICKGATAEEMIEAGRMVKEAGMELTEYVVLGLAGEGRGIKNAEETAKVLNAINPDHVRLRTLILTPGAPLFEMFQQGDFKLPSKIEILEETRKLIEKLEITSWLFSDHVSNYLPITGKLPEEKPDILEFLDTTIETLKMYPELESKILTPEKLRHL
jgi:radical SAM superfamily enzyme YgiQ (UPF0313 family)